MTVREAARGVALVCALHLVAPPIAPAQTSGTQKPLRPLRIDDVLAWEDVGSFSVSRDGRAVVFTRVRPTSLPRHLPKTVDRWAIETELFGNARSDVWLQDAPGRAPRNLTNGVTDGSGWWAPQWSPDGQWLVMMSSRGENVGLWRWHRLTNRLSRIAVDRAVADGGITWVDAHRVLCAVLPQRRSLYPESGVARPRGDELTASALESGVPVDPRRRQEGQLLLVDVAKGTTTVLVPHTVTDSTPAPGGAAVAYLREVGRKPFTNDRPVRQDQDSRLFTVEVRFVDRRTSRLQDSLPSDVLRGTVRWSPDGNELAFLSYRKSRDLPPGLWHINVTSGKVEELDLGTLDAAPWAYRTRPQLEWSKDGQLLFAAAPQVAGKRPGIDVERTWWLLARNGTPRFLTEEEKSELMAVRDDDESAQRAQFEKTVQKPAPEATLQAFSATSRSGIYVATNRNGTVVWRVDAATPRAEKLLSVNTHLSAIAEAEFKAIEYTSLDGERLKGWLILPLDYQAGKRYPLLVKVYPGAGGGDLEQSIGQSRSGNSLESVSSILNMQIPAAAGYGVLIPNMPMKLALMRGGTDGADDPLSKLTNGVVPAVDHVIALGIADPERVFLMGHSYGGYATYGLVTQTNRFRAAAALAGLPDLADAYGSFDSRFRYDDAPHEEQPFIGWAETGQGGMGNPPWKDRERYLRNSPITYVDQVETPLLMIHGDLDFSTMPTVEKFFTALNRQDKRAQLVRYWGEGHVLHGPENIRDMWRRIFAWFDEFGDVTRDARGRIVFEGDRAKSRDGAAALEPGDYAKFDMFQKEACHGATSAFDRATPDSRCDGLASR